MYTIYTDGSSNGRSKSPFGWGYVILKDFQIIASDFGGGTCGTNNIAELLAIYFALKKVHEFSVPGEKLKVTVISDSEYALGVSSGNYNPKKNLDLIQRVRLVVSLLDVEFLWVRGHSGALYNELADYLAFLGKRPHDKKLRNKPIKK